MEDAIQSPDGADGLRRQKKGRDECGKITDGIDAAAVAAHGGAVSQESDDAAHCKAAKNL